MKTPISLEQSFPSITNVLSPREGKSFPTLHYSGPADLDLPQSGTMEVTFKVRSATKRFDENGKETYECSIDIISIDEVECDCEAPAKSGSEAADALDKLMAEKEKENEEFDSDELAAGTEEEMEHTDDPEEAAEIAKDHLRETPDYYTKLKKAGLYGG